MGTLTQRDKKLLVFLACFVLIVVFGWFLAKPLLDKGMEKGDQISEAQAEKEMLETKLMQYPVMDKKVADSEEQVSQYEEKFYGMLKSQGVDKLITEKALSAGLKIERMEITMPTEPLLLENYLPKGEEADGSEVPADETEDVDDDADAAVDAEEEATAKSIYKATAKLSVSGTRDQYWNLINDINGSQKLMLVKEMQMPAKTEDGGSMSLSVDIFMYQK
ncbi:type II secretion system protein M [Ohessyouella blattaphilus]|uniref:Type II secretion system protein M n=1 Tax=Ohessyouella blattaphilus TaxID=2949333 RepID=A0ABT1EJT5_9FIRM|nr:type II secretion system protein M [Ohessyouella blattaphilus]MCP1110965.1 type II secretion system protein M [Ohessyouella blattaphilus]MCR8564359.1 type II secretion system protein M [Ohessyouella blattaphilus]